MDKFEQNKEVSINIIINIVKFISLFFCALVIYNKFFVNNDISHNVKDDYVNFLPMSLLTGLLALLYWLWSLFIMKKLNAKYVTRARVVENFVFVAIFAMLVMVSNTYISNYKFLFLLIIITATIQLGMKYGLIMSFVSSLVILLIDLIYAPKAIINPYFEEDLILVGVFILTAWTLGYYVKIENEYLKEKNNQLRELNDELNKKDSQRKYFEAMLLKNDECYNLLIENSRDAIFVHSDGNLIFFSKSAANMLGVNDNGDIGVKSIFDLTPLDERDSLKAKFDLIGSNEINTMQFEGKILGGNGETVHVLNISTHFIYQGQSTILTILHDITSEKQVEKLQKDVEKNIELLNETREYNKLITEFFTNISHELKTPLNVIFSALQVLDILNKNNHQDEKLDRYTRIMKQNCYRLMRLINNLLDIARLDSGFLNLNLENYNIVEVVEDITMSVVTYAESKGIELIFDTEIEEKVMAVDPDKLERIILNLLSNSIKFTNPGGSIFVELVDKGDNVVININDTGIGIPKEKKELIFERFGQVDKTLQRDCEGTGIGLCLVKSFVEMHGGEIDLESELGKGSKFIMILPVKHLEQTNKNEIPIYESSIQRIETEFSDIYSVDIY
ncbi:MAG: ATP-binding protein [Bacillota bacterium]|nr:ATP-binding protein [Bacillota bacterium]